MNSQTFLAHFHAIDAMSAAGNLATQVGRDKSDLAMRFAGNCDVGFIHRRSDRSDTTLWHLLVTLKFATQDADVPGGLNADRNAVSIDAIDGQDDVVTDEQLLAFFAAQNQHFVTSLS